MLTACSLRGLETGPGHRARTRDTLMCFHTFKSNTQSPRRHLMPDNDSTVYMYAQSHNTIQDPISLSNSARYRLRRSTKLRADARLRFIKATFGLSACLAKLSGDAPPQKRPTIKRP